MIYNYFDVKEFVEDLKENKISKVFINVLETENEPNKTVFIFLSATDGTNIMKISIHVTSFNVYAVTNEQIEEVEKKVKEIYNRLKNDLAKKGFRVVRGYVES